MDVISICQNTKQAANIFAGASTALKNSILSDLKEIILENSDELIEENKKDLEVARKNGRNQAFLDRLALNEKRIKQMADGLDAVIALEDPVGEVVEQYSMPNGMCIKKVRAPLGVIGIIFEARPNVAVDASALCIKSGNGVVLKGSSESVNSVTKLVQIIKLSLAKNGVDINLVSEIDASNRENTTLMLKQDSTIDVVIPRGGEALKKVVLDNATMPVIASAGGNCHAYVSKYADLELAKTVVLNAKINRPSTCNALETLLIDISVAPKWGKDFCNMLADAGVEVRCTERAAQYCSGAKIIEDSELYSEYADMIIKVDVVDGLDKAIEHINKYSTNHSDLILTEDAKEAEEFLRKVDSAVVYVNVSTRFTDGFEMGLGAEMGISTQKLHVRGPIGLRELTSVKYNVIGSGQLRK